MSNQKPYTASDIEDHQIVNDTVYLMGDNNVALDRVRVSDLVQHYIHFLIDQGKLSP